jgi:Flp pilus assembly protein TadG
MLALLPFPRLLSSVADRSGAGAVEFALIVPLLLMLQIGGVDITRAIIFSHKLQNATTAVNDFVSQLSELDKTKVEGSFAVADKMLAQYRIAPIHIRVTTVEIDADGYPKVLWSVARGMARARAGTDFELPQRLAGHRGFTFVVTETEHDFQPIMAYVVQEAIPLRAKAQGRFRGRDSNVCLSCAQ